MSYQVLARKWRPRIFREMVGQEHVLQALINALDHNRLHHAYLFTGTRGVGKTTIARILAKCLNCETGVSSEPCGTCSACREIAEGRFVDLIEVDAAFAVNIKDTLWHPTQAIFIRPDGVHEFSFRVRGLKEILYFVLWLGHGARVKQPKSLQDLVKAELKAIAGRY